MQPQETDNTPLLAIIGIGCIFPKAQGLQQYWENIRNGVDAIAEVPPTHWDPDDYFDSNPDSPDMTYARRGGFLDPVDFAPMRFGMSPNALEATDTAQLLGLVAAERALEDAGYGSSRQFDRDRASVILGVTGALELVIPLGARLGHPAWRRALRDSGVDDQIADEVIRRISESYVPWQENSFPGLLGNVVAGRIANRLNLGGTNCVVDAACASSIGAVHLAAMELASGRSDLVLTGGVDTFNDIFMYMCFSKTPALSKSGDARPFDVEADGTILGEGVGIVVLKRLADAERDGDRICAVIRAIGTSSDGSGNAVYAPKSLGQQKALNNTYAQAGVSPASVELVEAHGTGTKVGDAIELDALSQVYRASNRNGRWCALGSVKSQIGHTKAAAGAASLIKAAMALRHRTLPPTLKVRQPAGAIEQSPFYLSSQPKPWIANRDHPRRAAVSSFGFGGSNFHCLLEEYRGSPSPIDWDSRVDLLAVSAATPALIQTQLTELLTRVQESQDDATGEIAAGTRRRFRSSDAYRLCVAWDQRTSLLPSIKRAIAQLQSAPETPWSTPDGFFYGVGDSGKLAMVFPGQGSQYLDMHRDLACQFPIIQDVLEEADREHATGGLEPGDRLSDLIYPMSAYETELLERQKEQLRDTRIAQPALGAVCLGLVRVLEHFAICPDVVAGHSYGEIIALCVAGRIDAQSLHRLSNLRGKLMSNGQTRGGTMLAVQAGLAEVESVQEADETDLVIANKNAPQQYVLSGSFDAIARAERTLQERGISCRRLPVSGAFHSPLVASARGKLRKALAEISFAASRVPVFSNSTACLYPTAADQAREVLAEQLARPVEFVSEVRNMFEHGVTHFVEVGPGQTLTGLVESILPKEKIQTIALDSSRGRRPGQLDLARILAFVAATGRQVDLTRWHHGIRQPLARTEGFTVPICGANYRSSYAEAPPPGPRPVEPASRRNTASEPNAKSQPPDSIPVVLKADNTVMTDNADKAAAPPKPPRGTRAEGGAGISPVPTSQNGSNPPGPLSAPIRQPSANSDHRPNSSSQLQSFLEALQQIQRTTAQLHEKFLDGQIEAQKTLQTLLAGTNQNTTSAGEAEPLAPRAPSAVQLSPPAPELIPADPPAPRKQPTTAEPAIAQPPDQTGSTRSDHEATLLQVVSEKTGYPAEMLDLSMELDADLGIDSIKRVEIYSAIKEKLADAPEIGPDHIGSLHTLNDICQLLGDSSAVVEPEPAAVTINTPDPPDRPPAAGQRQPDDRLEETFLTIVSDKTGYPVEMLELDMELDADLGIDSIKRVEILSALRDRYPELPDVRSEDLGSYQTLDDIVGALQWHGQEQPGSSKESTDPQPEPSVADLAAGDGVVDRYVLTLQPVPQQRVALAVEPGSVIWIAGRDPAVADSLTAALRERSLTCQFVDTSQPLPEVPANLSGLILASSAQMSAADLWGSLRTLQHAGSRLRERAIDRDVFVTGLCQFDGRFGLSGRVPGEPLSAGISGMVKTVSWEWPQVRCKVIDIGAEWRVEAAGRIDHECNTAGPIEVGLDESDTWAIALEKLEPTSSHEEVLRQGDAVVITGGGRGITADVAVALAQRSQVRILILGRTATEEDPPWLDGAPDEASIRTLILENSPNALTPKELDQQSDAILRSRETRRTVERIRQAGGEAIYKSVDVRDSEAVKLCVSEVEALWGPIRGIIHGAGVLADQLVDDKTKGNFDFVYETKVEGLNGLVRAISLSELRLAVLFSSSTARFGRIGQVDYAVANEILNKQARALAAAQPNCKVLSVNWGPWDGGMVQGGLRRVFEREGIRLIEPAAGSRYLLEEIAATQDPVEVVALGAGSLVPMAGSGPNPDSQSGDELKLAFERELSIQSSPILKSHVMKGQAVLPMALMIEWMGHAALHANPGLTLQGFDSLKVLKAVALSTGQQQVLRLKAGRTIHNGATSTVFVSLENGSGRKHCSAQVILSAKPPQVPEPAVKPSWKSAGIPIAEVYSRHLFHGADLQGIERIDSWCAQEGIAGRVRSAPMPSSWLDQPLRNSWLTDPLIIDSCLQLLIVWTVEAVGAPSLPVSIGKYRQYCRTFPSGTVDVTVWIQKATSQTVVADIQCLNGSGEVVATLEAVEMIMDPSLLEAFRHNEVAPQATP